MKPENKKMKSQKVKKQLKQQKFILKKKLHIK